MTADPIAPARSVVALLDAGASAPAVIALVHVREVHRRLALLEAELDRQALRPVTDARFRELLTASAVLNEIAERLTSARRRLDEVK